MIIEPDPADPFRGGWHLNPRLLLAPFWRVSELDAGGDWAFLSGVAELFSAQNPQKSRR
jgi:hypothetical protein